MARDWHGHCYIVCVVRGDDGTVLTGETPTEPTMQTLHKFAITAVFTLTCFSVPVLQASGAENGSGGTSGSGQAQTRVPGTPRTGDADSVVRFPPGAGSGSSAEGGGGSGLERPTVGNPSNGADDAPGVTGDEASRPGVVPPNLGGGFANLSQDEKAAVVAGSKDMLKAVEKAYAESRLAALRMIRELSRKVDDGKLSERERQRVQREIIDAVVNRFLEDWRARQRELGAAVRVPGREHHQMLIERLREKGPTGSEGASRPRRGGGD